MEALSELTPIPYELLDNELFSHLDDLSRFSFRATCRHFLSKRSPDQRDRLTFLEAMLLACRHGYVNLLKYWFPGDERPLFQVIEYLQVALLYGQVSTLEWLAPVLGPFAHESTLMVHAIMSDNLATVRYLFVHKVAVSDLAIKVAKARGNTEIVSFLTSSLPVKKPGAFEFGSSSSLIDIYSSLPKAAHEIDYAVLSPILLSPQVHALMYLLERRAILFSLGAINGIVKSGLWKLVKAICVLQEIPPFSKALPVPVGTLPFYTVIGHYASSASDSSILIWFLNHGYVDTANITIVPLLKGKKDPYRYVFEILQTASPWTIKTIIRGSLSVSVPRSHAS